MVDGLDRGASDKSDRAFVPTASSPQAVSPVPASIPSASRCPTCGVTSELFATRVSAYYMLDSHLFRKLFGSPVEIVERLVQQLRADEGEAQNSTRYGMLCPVIVSAGHIELRRVGPAVHARGGSDEHIAKFRADAEKWIDAIYADPDVPWLLTAQAIEARSGETRRGSTEGESAVSEGDAPNPHSDTGEQANG